MTFDHGSSPLFETHDITIRATRYTQTAVYRVDESCDVGTITMMERNRSAGQEQWKFRSSKYNSNISVLSVHGA